MNMYNTTAINNIQERFQKATYFLLLVPPPILIGFGTAGNLIALYVMNRNSRLRKESVVVYLRLYLIISTLVLIIGSGQDWICHAAGLPFLWNSADYVCRLWEFSSSLLFYFPPWVLSAILVDRCLLAAKSSLASTVCDVFSAKVISVVIFVGLATISVHVLWTFELHPVFGCAIPPDRHDFHSIVWPWVSVIAYSFFPIGVLLVCIVYLLFLELNCAMNIPKSHKHINNKDTTETVYVCSKVKDEIENVNNDKKKTSSRTIELKGDINEDGIHCHQHALQNSFNKTETEESLPSQKHYYSALYPKVFSSEEQVQFSAVPNKERNLAPRTLSDSRTDGVKKQVARRTLSDGQVVGLQPGCVTKCGARRTTSDGAIELLSHSFDKPPDQRMPILTTMSICMGLICVIATLPATVLNVFVMQAPVNSVRDQVKIEKLKFVFAFLQMVVVFSKSMMPFIVCLTAPMLREDVRHSFRSFCNSLSKRRSDSVVVEKALNGTLHISSSVCPDINDSRV